MTQPIRTMLPTTFDQMSVYALACFQFPNVTSPATGTTDTSIAMDTGPRSHSGNHITKS
jgi:hypothetical protein